MQAASTITRRHGLGALLHLPGIGPLTEQLLRLQGIGSQRDLLRRESNELPGFADCAPPRTRLARQCEKAIESGDIAFLLRTFHRSDHWRILTDFMDRATFLDIETTGDHTAPDITLIVCLHGRYLNIFTAGATHCSPGVPTRPGVATAVDRHITPATLAGTTASTLAAPLIATLTLPYDIAPVSLHQNRMSWASVIPSEVEGSQYFFKEFKEFRATRV